MSNQHAYFPSPSGLGAGDRKSNPHKEFASLGNFSARAFQSMAWNGETMSMAAVADRRIIPNTGITVPWNGQ